LAAAAATGARLGINAGFTTLSPNVKLANGLAAAAVAAAGALGVADAAMTGAGATATTEGPAGAASVEEPNFRDTLIILRSTCDI
jgi:hypothetical protein